jgi:hypothetical protein
VPASEKPCAEQFQKLPFAAYYPFRAVYEGCGFPVHHAIQFIFPAWRLALVPRVPFYFLASE